MSTRDSAESARLDVAVKKMKQYRDITVRDAMKLADFSAIDINNKIMQRKILWRLPGKVKHQLKVIAMEGGDHVAHLITTAVTRMTAFDHSELWRPRRR